MRGKISPRRGGTGLLIVDVQERLLSAMPGEAAARLVKSHSALIEMATSFCHPIIYTEQYPKGLGATVSPLRECLEDCLRIEKLEFSALLNQTFRETALEVLPGDIIVTGMETHVCVLQTAVDLLNEGFRVFVPLDAVASRTDENRCNGLALMERAGAVVTNTETLVFDRLQVAKGDTFKRLSKLVR